MKRHHHGNHWFLPTSAALKSEFLHGAPTVFDDLDATHYSAPSPDPWLMFRLLFSCPKLSHPPSSPQPSWPLCLCTGNFLSLERFSPYWSGELWPFWEKTPLMWGFSWLTQETTLVYTASISSISDSCFGVITSLHKNMNFVQSQTSSFRFRMVSTRPHAW